MERLLDIGFGANCRRSRGALSSDPFRWQMGSAERDAHREGGSLTDRAVDLDRALVEFDEFLD
jgi:hypothetical protein